MGLQSALTTSLTGLNAAETMIDVVGNNLANSQTVGFKESEVIFATQFLQTLGLGSSSTENRGGTNPRQFGLGTQVTAITPNFTQGTIEVSSSPSDLAIQGDGFFTVQSASAGEQLFTRNGIFETNSADELVTPTGHRLLGFGVDDDFVIQQTSLEPITIPLGSAAVAQATENVFFEGTLSPTGEVATTAEILQTGILGDAAFTFPDPTTTASLSTAPTLPGTFTAVPAAGGGALSADGSYRYRFVYSDRPLGSNPPGESRSVDFPPATSPAITLDTGGAGEDQIDLTDLPLSSSPYVHLRVYRTTDLNVDPNSSYFLVQEFDRTGDPPLSFMDQAADATIGANQALDTDLLSGTYDYFVVFSDTAGGPPNGNESRPSAPIEDVSVANGRILLENIPTDANWTVRRIYRNVQGASSDFHFVAEIPNMTAGEVFTDTFTDAEIVNNTLIDLDGPRATESTLLSNLLVRDGNVYDSPFGNGGDLTFTARKGGRATEPKSMTLGAGTTVGDWVQFIEDSVGIQDSPPGVPNPILDSQIDLGLQPSLGLTQEPGLSVSNGQILLVSNNGEGNAVEIDLDGFQLSNATGTTNIDIPFASIQSAQGESAVADFLVFDTLGIPLSVRVTTVLEARTSSTTTYRWFADSPDNDPTTGSEISVGTGLITFDTVGNVLDVSNSTVNIQRETISSSSPLSFQLDFSELSGLEVADSTLAASRQDGFAAGVLSSFIIGEDGGIRGVFTNGATRDLGQIVLARFANPSGLEQRGENLFASGVNSGLPVQGNPGAQGIGTLVAGAIELSNTDVGQNLIDLILASTQYRSNTRVINTSQQLLDELLNLRR